MRHPSEIDHLLKAIDAFNGRIIVVSPEFRILACNRPMGATDPCEVIGQTCHKVFYGRSSPCLNCSVKEALDKRQPCLSPKPTSSLELDHLPCYFAYPIFAGERIEALVSMDFHLPTRVGIDQKLHQNNVLLRNLFLSAVDGVIAADRSGNILIFNEAAEQIFGYTKEEALHKINIRDIYPDNFAYEVMRKMRSDELGGRGKLRSLKVDVVTKNGRLVPISLNAAIVHEGDREVASIGFFHDLREELRVKAVLEKTQLQLLQAEKMASLGKLAAGVAHQLNNPLAGITLYTKLILEEYSLEEAIRDDLHRILEDAERCRDTVKELLEFTRQTRHLMKPMDINKAIERTLFLLENQTLFQNIKIVRELAPQLPLIHGDIQQINHMLMNNILNAAQAMQAKGELVIRTRQRRQARAIRIDIMDSGPGIPDHVLPHIFEPFFTTKDEGQGTGLGLSMVYGIVSNHGGTIVAANRPGQGAVFTIELPLSVETVNE
jgi:PAS domain S-box-containing protein